MSFDYILKPETNFSEESKQVLVTTNKELNYYEYNDGENFGLKSTTNVATKQSWIQAYSH